MAVSQLPSQDQPNNERLRYVAGGVIAPLAVYNFLDLQMISSSDVYMVQCILRRRDFFEIYIKEICSKVDFLFVLFIL